MKKLNPKIKSRIEARLDESYGLLGEGDRTLDIDEEILGDEVMVTITVGECGIGIVSQKSRMIPKAIWEKYGPTLGWTICEREEDNAKRNN